MVAVNVLGLTLYQSVSILISHPITVTIGIEHPDWPALVICPRAGG